MKRGVSVIICTYNGASRLPTTLQHLAQQEMTIGIDWEVILIDNNSTDSSAAVAQAAWQQYKVSVPFIIKTQLEQGLTASRELGIQTAQYDYLIFCDDDNWLGPQYISKAFEVMHHHPRIGILGGNGELVYEVPPPGWLLPLHLLAGGPQAPQSGKVASHIVYGAGCVLRQSAYRYLQQQGFEPFLSDRKGAQLASGGDHELCYALALAGYEVWYEEALTFQHYIDAKRLTWPYWVKYVTESSACQQVLEPYKMIVSGVAPTTRGFFAALAHNLAYFTKKLAAVYGENLLINRQSDAYKTNYLKTILLKKQLSYCLHYRTLKHYFYKIAALKEQLKPSTGVE